MKLKGLQFPVLLGAYRLTCFSFWFYLVHTNTRLVLDLELISYSTLSFSLRLIFDKINLRFGAVVGLIAGCVFTFGHKYIEDDFYSDRFLWVLMAFVVRINLLTWSGSLLFLLLGWDGLGITSFALIIYYQRSESLNAGFQTLIINRVGDAFIVVARFLFVSCHTFSLLNLDSSLIISRLVYFLRLAALTKSAQYPFRRWLPAAIAAPTPVRALVHSSTLVTAGIYLIIRLSSSVPLPDTVQNMLLFVGAITSLLGGWAATQENDLKKIIALSTLSQLGVMCFCLGLGYSQLALFHLYTHALFKALLFLAAGHILMSSFGTQDIRLIGSIGLSIPITVVIFNIRRLCLVGAPFLRAFYSKHLILETILTSRLNLLSLGIILVATMITAKYVARSLKRVSWDKPIGPMSAVHSNFFTSFPVLLLGAGGIVAGKFYALVTTYSMEVIAISSWWAIRLNLVTLVGLFIGIFMAPPKRYFLSTMFFLSPRFRTKVSTYIIKAPGCMDYGWLEPFYAVNIRNSGAILAWGLWPNKQVFISFFFASLLILMYTL